MELAFTDKEVATFGKGLSQYLLTTFYARLKKQHQSKLPQETKSKLKVMFDMIKKKTESIFVES